MFCLLIGVTLNAARNFNIAKIVKENYQICKFHFLRRNKKPFFEVYWIPDSDFFGFDETNPFLPLNNCLCIGCNVICDIIMAIFGFKTMKTLSAQRSKMREHTYRMHKRLMHALIVQVSKALEFS